MFEFFAKIARFTSAEWLLLIQDVVLALSLIVATITIVVVAQHQKKTRTLVELEKLRIDSNFDAALKKMHKSTRRHSLTLVEVLEKVKKGKATPTQLDLYRSTVLVISSLELLAGGIRDKTFNEAVVKQAYYTTIVEVIGNNGEFIQGHRSFVHNQRSFTKNARMTTYENIIWLFNRWKKSPLKTKWWRKTESLDLS